MSEERNVWCGFCQVYTTKESFEKIHIPRHSKSLLDAAGFNKSDQKVDTPTDLSGEGEP